MEVARRGKEGKGLKVTGQDRTEQDEEEDKVQVAVSGGSISKQSKQEDHRTGGTATGYGFSCCLSRGWYRDP